MGGGRKLGAYSILATIFTGFFSWVATELPQAKSEIQVHHSEINNNKEGIQEIKKDLSELRKGQTKILEILIQQRR
jgi:hypothetical protein